MRLVALMAAWAIVPAMAADTQSPYAGEQEREIKALSAERIQQYLGGAGMGYAKAAELNAFPGPKHVLELRDPLELSEAQVAATQDIFDAMQERASDLGRQLVELERLLDQLFAEQVVTESSLESALTGIARLEGEIRYTHLAAHLQQRRILSDTQVRHYEILRGYGAGHGEHAH